MAFFLKFHLNAYPICLVYLNCENEYGKEYTCKVRVIEWKRKKIEHDYTVDFYQKPLTQQGATKQKVILDLGFVDWFFTKVSSQIEPLSFHNNINICQSCINIYNGNNKSMFYTIFFFLYL